MSSILSRYILREAAQTWIVVTVVLLLILLTNTFAQVLGDAASDKLPKDAVVVVNLSGRGDKDVSIVEQHRPMQ